jgi:hypothetical protein
MKQITIVAAIFAMSVTAFGQAAISPGQLDLTRAIIKEKRQEIITHAMSFTDAEAKAFWPVYKDWRAKNTVLGDRKLELIIKVEDSARLSDAETKPLVETWLKIEDDQLKLKKEYVKKFRAVLPEKKVARFFQLENKLDAVVNFDLAGHVALAE